MAIKKRAFLPPIIIFVAVALAMVLAATKAPPEQNQEERPAVLVDTMEVAPQDIRFQVASQGTVEPRHQTSLVAEVGGRVMALADNFVVGGFFEEGDMLVQIDQSDYRVMVQEARANLAQARAALEEELARAQVAKEEWASIEQGNIPSLGLREPQVASAVASVESAEARLQKAERDLQRTTIRAPFDGLLRSRSVDVGQYIGVGSQVAMILGTEVAEIRLPLSDRDLAYLELPIQGAELTTEPDVKFVSDIAGQQTEWFGKLVRSEGILDSNSRVIYGVVQVRDPYNQEGQTHAVPLRFGRFVQAAVAGNEAKNVFVLPRYALTSKGTVWVVDDERKIHEVEVNVRRTDANEVFVSDGLQRGDKVMLTQLANPLPGMKVRLQGDPLPATEEPEASSDETLIGN
ncbi:MAG: efflux RND transporter periplasmic adaptor subunit [Idiomarina sp.]